MSFYFCFKFLGDDLGSFFLIQYIMRGEQITSPSLSWLLPSPLFWKTDEVLVETTARQYTYGQMEDFFRDLQYPTGWEMRKDTIQYAANFTPPGVEIHCIYGHNVDTVEKIRYKKSDVPDGKPDLIMGDGDGTVNLRSLEGCMKWEMLQTQPVTTVPLKDVDHMSILSDGRVVKYIADLMTPK